jgi:6-phosphogluconolactonase
MLKTSRYVNKTQLDKKFARKIAGFLRTAIEGKGFASLIVSGGSTPVGLFQALSQIALPWEHIVVSLADERWVDTQDDASNEKLVKTHLLTNHAACARFVSLKPATEASIDGAIQHTSTEMAAILPADIVILGMGNDGHTASLFPCSEQINDGLEMETNEFYIAVQPTTAPHQRVSLRLPAIANANHVFLHIVGNEKKAVLDTALNNETDKPLPIRSVIENADVELVWAP